jgi:hypothetical protein
MLKRISIDDDRLVENTLAKQTNGQASGLLSKKKGELYILSPSQYFPGENPFATVTLSAKEFVKLIENKDFAIIAATDQESRRLPKIAQRVPTGERIKHIRDAWYDNNRTYPGTVIGLSVFVFNTRLSGEGLVLNEDSLLVLTDAAGRFSAAFKELTECIKHGDVNNHVAIQKDMRFQLNLNLSGIVDYATNDFVSRNRDQKRSSTGTILGVETGRSAALTSKQLEALSYGDAEGVAHVIAALYDLPVTGSITELLPWQFEGVKSTCAEFHGIGRASSLRTAFNESLIKRTWMESGVSLEEAPIILDLGLRTIYKQSPEAIDAARLLANSKNKRGLDNFHIHSTLAIKVMLLMIGKLIRITKDPKKLGDLMDEVIATHFRHHKDNGYVASGGGRSFRKMDLRRFWQCSIWFNGQGFNSGQGNTGVVLGQLNTACEDILEKYGAEKVAVAAQKQK